LFKVQWIKLLWKSSIDRIVVYAYCDRTGLDLIESYQLVNNVMWANDYPHAEGTWPHSAQAIERTMFHLQETSRSKILGLNAARIFNFSLNVLSKKS